MVQYSTGLKALISCSRSTINRTATVCTRPAESPRRTLSHKQRRNFIADQAIEHAPGLLGVNQIAVDRTAVFKGGLDRLGRDFVERNALNCASLRDILELLLEVIGDRFAFAVGIGGKVDLVRLGRQLLQAARPASACPRKRSARARRCRPRCPRPWFSWAGL